MSKPEKEKCNALVKETKLRCKYDAVEDGLCRRHFNLIHQPKKEQKTYIPDRSKIPNRENGLCKEYIEGTKQCTKSAKTEGLCTYHYNRKDKPKKETASKYDDKDRCTNNDTGKRCGYKKKRGEEICARHYRLKLEKEGKQLHTLTHDGETKACKLENHWTMGSPYPKEAVPIENFYIKNDPNNIATVCVHCREYRRECYAEKTDQNKEKREEENKKDSPFRTCFSEYHEREGVSQYPRNKVPKEKFFVEIRKGEMKESLRCEDCRCALQTCKKETHQKHKEEAAKQGKFHCKRCFKTKNDFQMAIFSNGERSEQCCRICQIKCLRLNSRSYKRAKDVYRDIQREKMEEIGCSCNRCKGIFLKPDPGSYSHIKLETFLKDGIRYVIYKDELLTTKDFMHKYQHLLEYRTLDLDHLNEKEQRERGIIGPNDEFIKKKKGLSQMRNEKDMREEAKITQILCVECHVRVGLERTVTGPRNYDELKLKIITDLRKSGCQCCGWYDENLLRFLEFDHIDPSTKIDTISNMLRLSDYTIEELAVEIIKCRVLCRACHRMRTWEQKQEIIRLTDLKYEQEVLPYLQENDIKVMPIYGDEEIVSRDEFEDSLEDLGDEELDDELMGELEEEYEEDEESYDF